MKCGMVILNYNDYETTMNLLNEIIHYEGIDNIVVVDNCSTDDSYIRLKENKTDKWDLIRTKSNIGYARGNNCGIKYLIKKYNIDIIGISNSDVLFSEEFIKKIKKDFEEYDYDLLTGMQMTAEGDPYFKAFWNRISILGSYWLVLINLFLFSRLKKVLRWYPKDKLVNDSISEQSGVFQVDVVGGCLFFIKREAFERVDYFDSRTFLFFEEDILCCKLRRQGYKIGVDSDIKFTHLGSHSIEKSIVSDNVYKYLFESEKLYFRKYLTSNRILYFILKGLISVFWIERKLGLKHVES